MIKPNEEILDKFYNNDCTVEEQNLVIDYLNSLESEQLNEFLDNHLQKVENKSFDKSYSDNNEINSIIGKISIEEKNNKVTKRKYYSIAASVAFLLIISIAALYYFGSRGSESADINWIEKIANPGQKVRLTLIDGSKVILNSGSKISYPDNFGSELRNVVLDGEAFFEVTHNSNNPFTVKTSDITTTVLGTKFNVNAYQSNKNIIISLVEGEVKVSNKNILDTGNAQILKPSQQFSYNKEIHQGTINKFDVIKTTGWKDNILIFDKDPLKYVFEVLSRAYGVKFELKNEMEGNQLIKAEMNNQSFWDVVKIINIATDLKYEPIYKNEEVDKIIFYKE